MNSNNAIKDINTLRKVLYRKAKRERLHLCEFLQVKSITYNKVESIIIANLMEAWSRNVALIVPGGRGFYVKRFKHLSFLKVRKALEKFEKEQLIKIVRNNSRIRRKANEVYPTELINKFNNLELQVCVADVGTFVVRENKKITKISQGNSRLKRINEALNKHSISLPGIEIPPEFCMYKRVFANKSHSEGGRFYNRLQSTLSKKERNYIMLDGEETVELDFVCMHPTSLYNQAGLDLPVPDCYLYEGDLRAPAKLLLNCLLNCQSKKSALKAVSCHKNRKNWNLTDIQLAEMLDKIITHNVNIEKHFFNSAWRYLQASDSRIAEKILSSFAGLGHPILCWHDSFVVKKSDEILLRSIMSKAYKEVIGTTIKPNIRKE